MLPNQALAIPLLETATRCLKTIAQVDDSRDRLARAAGQRKFLATQGRLAGEMVITKSLEWNDRC